MKVAAESPLRANQIGALSALETIGAEGMPLADRLTAERMTTEAAKEAGRGKAALRAALAARGRLGGGLELQAQTLADQEMADMYGTMGRDLATDALARKKQALLEAGQLSTAGREQDATRARVNAEMSNRFNEFVSNLKTDQAKYAADVTNTFKEREADERQRISDANRLMEYDVARDNLDRFNMLQRDISDFRLDRAGRTTGAYGDLATSERADKAAEERNIGTFAGGLGGAVGGGMAALYDYLKKRKAS